MSLPRRQWFQPGDGIAREVISADIQRYLGPDATVRPGVGTGDYEGAEGYWITAYKMLTSSQVQDLKQDSERWLSERRQGGRGSPHVRDTTVSRHSNQSLEYNQSYTHQQRQQHGPSEPVRHAEYSAPTQPTYSYQEQTGQYTYQQPSAGYPGYAAAGQTYQQQPRTATGYQYAPPAPAADPRYAQPADPRYGYPQSTSAPATNAYAPPQPSSAAHYSYQDPSRSSYPSQQQAYAQQPAYPQQYSQSYQYPQAPSSSTNRGGARR